MHLGPAQMAAPLAAHSSCLHPPACLWFVASWVQEEELLIKPAVMGTENVLTCVNATASVERVVVTSSTAAVFTDGTERGEGHVFTEADWNVIATPVKFPYFYSKKMAELVSTAAQQQVHPC